MRRALPLLLLLASCGDERPPAPTPEQAERLNEAEAMLDEFAKEEGAAPEDAAPSK